MDQPAKPDSTSNITTGTSAFWVTSMQPLDQALSRRVLSAMFPTGLTNFDARPLDPTFKGPFLGDRHLALDLQQLTGTQLGMEGADQLCKDSLRNISTTPSRMAAC